MSTRAEHGTSYRVTLNVPECPDREIQEGFAAYQEGGDGLFDWWHFKQCVRHGHILMGEILAENGEPVAVFGVELMRDQKGPYVSFLYFVGAMNADLVRTIVGFMKELVQLYHRIERFRGGGRLYLRGRRGWQRYLARLGLYIDADGFIDDTQEVKRDGIERRKW